MAIYVLLIAETEVRLWGLTSRERLRRVLSRAGLSHFTDDLAGVPADASVLLVRGDHLYDTRVLNGLIAKQGVILLGGDPATAVAAHVPAPEAARVKAQIEAGKADSIPSGLQTATPQTIGAGFETKLRKLGEAYVRPITAADQAALERQLFDGSYKGITDLVTKWAWPIPARWATRLCVRWGILPNQVTAMSWLLAILALYLFAVGQFGWGLLAGWVMTFLDTVDGKLARVTVTYTDFGNLFDHILDVVHPPFWYLAWAIGLTRDGADVLGFSLATAASLIFGGYILGRLAEGLFRRKLGDFSIFAWRPIDSFSRLITARRNPSLIMLSGATLLGRPDLGLAAVVLWTLISALFLWLRVAVAWQEKSSSGALQPWMVASDSDARKRSLAYRWFAR
jgi:phosphatidylglycerophosphate synthase